MKLIHFLLFSLSLTAFSQDRSKTPNIIYILADDLGYGDLACYGSKVNDTPNIDQLAKGGLSLTQFYAATWCLPSRVALMTGYQTFRPGLIDKNKDRLKVAELIPEMLKKKDYATALFGKWHLGITDGLHPNDQGFDVFFGTKGSNDWNGSGTNQDDFDNTPEEGWKTPYYIGKESQGIIPQSQMTKWYTRETLKFIEKNKDQPFFIYLSHNMPHVPVFTSDKFKGKSRNGVYGDVIMELDWSVGQVMQTLKDLNLENDTIVVFTSDNGPWSMYGPQHGGTAAPLRGEKGTCWEGGDRVPFILYWKGKIQAGVSDEFVTNVDIYSTFSSITNIPISEGQAIDSIDMSDVIFKKLKSQRKRHLSSHSNSYAFRSGDYKIHFATKDRLRNPLTGAKEKVIQHDPPLLFNIVKDKSETKNIASQYPELVEKMKLEYEEMMEGFKNWEKVPQ